MEDCSIKAVHSKDGKVSGVDTTSGSIECQYFVNCAGFWARQVCLNFFLSQFCGLL